ncbi:flagellar basal body L-ring protein FlgH [Parasphingorhabdus cellanae]|uniref:Flagellar L-ring protein n=1 Tax=Parasphingorhabdus cellanae TaxID=2806553 RepID=A0ABX7T4I6_9SPHN|nr:flagellar basal body L-ring protein FlgH [Parasphingorhabdus cellanae]QTD56498.1 flagellar basal body L-ring protein FlgH [Parasphingorhabdus cellanae]
MRGFSIILATAALSGCFATTDDGPRPGFSPTIAPLMATTTPGNGAIFQAANGYAALTSGARASRIGDVLTIQLVERTSAIKSNSAAMDRGGEFGLTPPTTGPLSFFESSDVNMGADQSFSGSGRAAQANSLSGEISVTIAEIYPNGTMKVKGEKLLNLNRGEEYIQMTGIVRAADISADNRILSSRVADARIAYSGSGEIARASKQGWLQKFFSAISPF